jgi:hypothetical protein
LGPPTLDFSTLLIRNFLSQNQEWPDCFPMGPILKSDQLNSRRGSRKLPRDHRNPSREVHMKAVRSEIKVLLSIMVIIGAVNLMAMFLMSSPMN